jgi:hypothetical protein
MLDTRFRDELSVLMRNAPWQQRVRRSSRSATPARTPSAEIVDVRASGRKILARDYGDDGDDTTTQRRLESAAEDEEWMI